MQPNSEKQDYTSVDVHPSYPTIPPPYSAFPQQPTSGAGYAVTGTPYTGQPPLPQQKRMVVVPVSRRALYNRIVIPVTPNLKIFLLLSGFLYSLWGISAFSVQIAIALNSYSTYYHGFWTGSFLIVGGIIMMVAGCRSAYPLAQLIRTYILNLIFCALGLVFSIVNYAMSQQCDSTFWSSCDDSFTINLKISLVVIYSVALIHTIFNMFYISKEQSRPIATSNPNIPNY